MHQHMETSPPKILGQAQASQVEKYLQAFLGQQIYFNPLVFSVDRMVGREMEAFVKRLGKHLDIKWDQLFLRIIDYLLACLSTACAESAIELCVVCKRRSMT